MNLITQLLSELGADENRAFTICPHFLGYFKCVKAVAELSPQKITLSCGKYSIFLEGENMYIAEFFQGDMIIKGDIKKVSVE